MTDEPDDASAATTQQWQRPRARRRGAHGESDVGRMFGHYRVLGRLGSGGMGTVYKVVDTRDGMVVALKVLFETDATGLRRINREFRRMADISHRNLVALYELGNAGSQRFLVMEFVPGKTFVEALRPGGVCCEPDRLRAAIRDLTLGVHALHERGRVHRDVKPSNVMVSDQGRVVILDFGLVNEIHRKTIQSSSMGLAGTPEYMAPEHVAGQLATPASDWYAVGVMLFEVVTGALPFHGPAVRQMLDKGQKEPPRPSLSAPDVPPELDRLIHGLLSREPGQRPSAPDLLAWCEGHLRAPMRPPPHAHVHAHALVGLDLQRQELADAYHRVGLQRRPVVVDVFGPSGTGKTALVQSLLTDLRRREDTVVLEGRCFAQESVDFKAFDSVMDALAEHLRRLPPADARSLVDDSFAALTRLFPVLARVTVSGEHRPSEIDSVLGVDAVQAEVRRRLNLGAADSSDGPASRARALRGLKVLLYRLALRVRLVLVIDDLQWGDPDSAHLLADLLAPPSPPALLFIGVWRTEDSSRSLLLRALAAQRVAITSADAVVAVQTGSLDADDATRLALQRLGDADRGTARRIAQESGGNPMLIEALAQHAALQVGSTRGAPPGGRSVSLEQLVERRLAALSPEASRLLETIAVAGQPITQDVLLRAAGLTGDRRPALGQLRAERLIRMSSRDPSAVEIYHDRIRVVVVHGLARHVIAEHHHGLAEALLAIGSEDLERIARHLFAAGERERAVDFAADAAHAAEQTLAFERAATMYRMASVCQPDNWIFKRKAGDALALAGRTREASAMYLSAAEQAPAAAAARLHRAAAESLLAAGQIEKGVATLRPLLSAIGASYPELDAQANTQSHAQLGGLLARGVAFVERSEPELPSRELTAIDTCMSAGKGLMLADPVRGGYYAARAAALALDAGEPRRIIRSLALAAMVGSPAAAHLWLQTAEELATRIKDQEALGIVEIHAGVIHRCRGAWHDAFEAITDGLSRLLEGGQSVAWERSFATTSLLTALEALGEIRRLASETDRLARQAQETGDRHTGVMAAIFGARILLARGDVAAARHRLSPAASGWPGEPLQVHVLHTLKVEVDCDLYAGDPERAWRRVLAAWPTLELSGITHLPIRRLEAFHIRARVAVAMLAHQPDNSHLGTVVESDLKQIGREPVLHARPLEALLRAAFEALTGRRAAVAQRLIAAIRGFDGVGMSLHATVARGCLGVWTRDDAEAGLVQQQAETFMRMQDIAEPQRWIAMTAPGLER